MIRKYRLNNIHTLIFLVIGNAILIGLAVNEIDYILKTFLGLGVLINTLICISLFFEYILVQPDRFIHLQWFGLVRHEVCWDQIGGMFYNADNKIVKAIRIVYGNNWEKSLIFNNSLIDYRELTAYIYDKAKDNRGFSVDYRVLDDINEYKELKK